MKQDVARHKVTKRNNAKIIHMYCVTNTLEQPTRTNRLLRVILRWQGALGGPAHATSSRSLAVGWSGSSSAVESHPIYASKTCRLSCMRVDHTESS
jgi:hypothetical protein